MAMLESCEIYVYQTSSIYQEIHLPFSFPLGEAQSELHCRISVAYEVKSTFSRMQGQHSSEDTVQNDIHI